MIVLSINVKANRFLRGMVRALTATMLKVGRGKIDLDEFRKIIESKDCTLANFCRTSAWLVSYQKYAFLIIILINFLP